MKKLIVKIKFRAFGITFGTINRVIEISMPRSPSVTPVSQMK